MHMHVHVSVLYVFVGMYIVHCRCCVQLFNCLVFVNVCVLIVVLPG